MANPFELLLFQSDGEMVSRATAAGIDGLVVDWEDHGKAERQAGAETEINHETYEDLCRVRAATTAPVICRVNGAYESTPAEVEAAIAGGADEILLPMVRTPGEVESVIRTAGGRCGVSILVETVAALGCAAELARLPLTRVYVGLNDLAIERRSANLFDAVIDGTVERVRSHFSVPFGFGGLTLPDRGRPVPCRLLVGEMARLDCGFAFLRRSFRRDIRGLSIHGGLQDIRQAVADARRREACEVVRDRAALETAVLAAQFDGRP